jgi:hypothetical protein
VHTLEEIIAILQSIQSSVSSGMTLSAACQKAQINMGNSSAGEKQVRLKVQYRAQKRNCSKGNRRAGEIAAYGFIVLNR